MLQNRASGANSFISEEPAMNSSFACGLVVIRGRCAAPGGGLYLAGGFTGGAGCPLPADVRWQNARTYPGEIGALWRAGFSAWRTERPTMEGPDSERAAVATFGIAGAAIHAVTTATASARLADHAATTATTSARLAHHAVTTAKTSARLADHVATTTTTSARLADPVATTTTASAMLADASVVAVFQPAIR